jgi:ABC-type antimicrobial peptide transport system permease subunit
LLTAAFAGFAVLAVAIVVLGLFGVVAHDVASRKRELALRLALGADRSRLMRATFGQGAAIAGGGLAAGALLSFWTTRVLGSWVVTTGQIDVVSIVVAGFVLMATAAMAVLPAAIRASRIDPVTALAEE